MPDLLMRIALGSALAGATVAAAVTLLFVIFWWPK